MTKVSVVACALFALTFNAVFAADDDKEKKPATSVKMEFKDAALDTVLEQLSDSTGLIIVKDAAIDSRITIISKQAMNVEDAISLLNTVLKEKGYVGIRTGKILKIVKLEEAKKRNIPVFNGNDPAKVDATDEVRTQVISIKYVDAVQLKKDFAPLMPSYADLSANALSNSLIVTDTGANVKRLLEIIHSLDTQTSTVASVKVFQLKYASATSAAKVISDVFKSDSSGQQQQQSSGGFFGRFRPPQFGGGGGEGTQDKEQGHQVQKVTASADDRTNTVVVSASADTLKIIEGIITDLDNNPATEQGVFMYRLKNAQSKNLESVLNSLFGASGSSSSRSSTSTSSRNAPGTGSGATRAKSSSGVTGSSGIGSSSTGTGSSRSSGFNQGAGGVSSAGGSSSVSGDLTGQVFIVADNDSNSLMVLTPAKNFDRVRAVIAELDKPVRQVVIKVLIAEVTHDKAHDVGTDSSILTSGSLKNVLTNFGVANQTTGAIAKLVTGDVTVALRALETEGKLEVLSRPSIVTSDNQTSNITVGQEVPFIVSSRTTDTGQTVNTIQYQDIGIILNVTAHINEAGLVIMDVAPEVSSLTGTTVPISDTVNAPVFAKRSASTRVGVQDGQTIVIGGLMEDKKTENNQGIPVLRKVPGLGLLFGRKQKDKSKTELLIFLTPHVAHEPGALEPMQQAESDALKLIPNAVKPGTYEEHRDGLNRGGPTIYSTDAVPVELPPQEKPVIEKK
ncbi:MAG: type II secretion system secretin GspD [Planctomycetota bacterium]